MSAVFQAAVCGHKWVKSPSGFLYFIFITIIPSDFLCFLNKLLGWEKCMPDTSGNCVLCLYISTSCRWRLWSTLWSVHSVVYKPFVYLQCRESLQPVAWDYGVCSYLEFNHRVKTGTQCRSVMTEIMGFVILAKDSFTSEMWSMKMYQGWFPHSTEHLHLITSSTCCNLETTSRPRGSQSFLHRNRSALLLNDLLCTMGNVFNMWGISETDWQ